MAQATRQSSLEGKVEADVSIKASAKKFHQMLAGRPQDLAKATPDRVKGCTCREGEFGKVGSVIVWNYVLDGQPMVAKERIEAVDEEKNLLVLRVIDGDMMKEFKSFLITIQAIPNIRGPGSVVSCHFKYERIEEKVAHPENLLALFVKTCKDMDELLLSEL
ncbi:PREDICTED: MLP-like protein 31 [Camelina sativa]|uniref:MLP-like protein 31 n=1 Tax=Camelina sativa TaxID=90675 RepID=A0ABM0WXK3_CAMSA|nr:PREDICTED: MLP-like protein 31 [Camelina sativa]